MTLGVFLPQDRLRALAGDASLPDRANGSALFADISGFTHLTEALRESLGPRRGTEELTKYLDAVYTGLIDEVERYGGSVIGFAGDSITCWFDESHGPASARAAYCAFALQRAMLAFTAIAIPNNRTNPLALKVAVASGPARRFVIGDPSIHYMDTLAGATIARTSAAEHLAGQEEILVDQATVNELGDSLRIKEWRQDPDIGERFAVVTDLAIEPTMIRLPPDPHPPSDDKLQVWIHPTIYEREKVGEEAFLTEFRPCIAMFVRFTGIDYDSEEALAQLDVVIRKMQANAEHHGGTLLQITIGDKGSYAYINFGAFYTHEDEARRAVKTAFDLKKDVEGLGFFISLQIGITYGVMRVGTCGSRTRRTFCALGDDVNLAARLMTNAAPGEILISERLRKSITDEFVVEARAPMKMKGKIDLLPVFAVLGAEQHRAIRLQEPAYASLMTGRRTELSLITEKIELAARGHGQIIGVTGEAGMGKSRLVAEGIRLARKSKLFGFGGACQSDGIHTPYLVWHSIWNAFFNIDPSTPLRKQIRTLEGELADRAPEHMDALPLLGTALGISLPENDFTRALQPRDRKAQLETLLVKCIESSAREAAEDGGGLILVLEDLHWIDPVSFDLLELVAQAIKDLPVLILLTYRVPDTSQQQLTSKRLEELEHFSQIRLNELNAQEIEQVIRSRLSSLFPERGGVVPRFLIDRITSRAQGNPFYAEELLNYLHDRAIDLSNITALEQLDLPTSLHSLILSRIDQLTSSQQVAIKVASVIGRVFRFEDLYNYYPSLGTAERLKSDLQELERLDLTPIESPEPELAYLFKHIVTQEVGYESLAYATRVRLHGQYARYLENKYPDGLDQLAPQLAYHFELAQISDKACFYLKKAGEQAAANYANDEALTYFNRALKLLGVEKTRRRFDILWKRERVYDLLGKRIEQRQDLDDLARLVDRFEDAPHLRAQIAIRQVKLEIDTGDYATANTRAQEATREIDPGVFPDLFIDALLWEARIMFLLGQAVAAIPKLENALALARTNQYARGEYNALAQLGLCSWHGGDNGAAIAFLKQSLDQLRKAGDIRRELEILNNLGIVTKDTYKFTDALGYYEGAQRIAKKIGDRSGEAALLNNMGRACFVSGDYIRAIQYCMEAEALSIDVREPITQGLALHNRSESYRELGQYIEAKNAADESLVLMRSTGYRVGESNTLENIALIEFSLGEYMEALEHANTALEIARDVAARRVEVSVLTRIGFMQLRLGQLEAAEKALTDAKEIEKELQESIPMFELHAGLAGVALARNTGDSLEVARSYIQGLVDEILQEPTTEQSHILPMGLYLMCIRVELALHDPCTKDLIARADKELHARSAKITEADLYRTYMNIPEHREIMALSGTRPKL